METRDWSLVFFTVLTQAAVGAFLTLRVLEYLSARREVAGGGSGSDHVRHGDREADGVAGAGRASSAGRVGRATALPLLVVLAVLSAGLFAALFHLSTPLEAARAVVNFSSSWLSREIVFGSLFAALLGALVLVERRAAPADPESAGTVSASPARQRPATGRPELAHPNRMLATWLPRLAAGAGLAFLGCQIAIYLLPAQPAWNSFATPAAFAGTALRLGVLGAAAGLTLRNLPGVGDPAHPGAGTWLATLRRLALAGIAALALEFLVVPLHLASLATNPLPAAAASVQRLTGDYGGILFLRLGLLGAAGAALGGVLARIRRPAGPSGPSAHRFDSALACGAFGLTAASEVCGRFLFYAMQVRVGI